MAAIFPRPRLALYAALLASLIAASCSLVKPVETPADAQEHAARLVRDGKHAEAAQAYADLAIQLPADSGNYQLLSAEQWVAAGNIAAAKQALGQLSPEARAKLANALDSARESIEQLEDKVVAGAKTADKTIREHPYESIGIALGIGLLIGVLVSRK